MFLTRVTCDRFRCLHDVVFEPGPGVNIIRGENAQGKTSLLEAIFYLATSKSHRTTVEAELVQYGQEGFAILGSVDRRSGTTTVEANSWNGAKRFKVNGVAQVRLSEILGNINVAFFSPEDLALVRGSASARRRFLDIELSQIQPAYVHALLHYRQALRQRNELLRAQAPKPEWLDPWDLQLANRGAVLIRERAGFVERLQAHAAVAHERIAPGESLTVTYDADVAPDTSLQHVLAQTRDTDLRQRMTTRGPHRDDIACVIDGHAARRFASQGQQRTVALALKLAGLELVRERTGEYPVFLLDDVLSELDAKRAAQLLDVIPADVQCILTTTDLTGRMAMKAECAHFAIQSGRLTKADAP